MVTAVASQTTADIVSTIVGLVATDGSSATPHAVRLASGDAPLRDLADAVHALCIIHGAFPGIVDHALRGATDDRTRDWLARAADHAAAERALLARLTASAGPLPSTPGQAASEAAILAQRHALEMLGRSDRAGCAAGTAAALLLDWTIIRRALDGCAVRTGVPRGAPYAPVALEARAYLATAAITPAIARAMTFGAQQMLAQHRGLWFLLEARASARDQLDRG